MSIRLAGFSPALQNLIKNPATLYGATAVGGAGLGALVEKIRSGVVTPEDQDREGQRAAPPTRASTESKPPISQTLSFQLLVKQPPQLNSKIAAS